MMLQGCYWRTTAGATFAQLQWKGLVDGFAKFVELLVRPSSTAWRRTGDVCALAVNNRVALDASLWPGAAVKVALSRICNRTSSRSPSHVPGHWRRVRKKRAMAPHETGC